MERIKCIRNIRKCHRDVHPSTGGTASNRWTSKRPSERLWPARTLWPEANRNRRPDPSAKRPQSLRRMNPDTPRYSRAKQPFRIAWIPCLPAAVRPSLRPTRDVPVRMVPAWSCPVTRNCPDRPFLHCQPKDPSISDWIPPGKKLLMVFLPPFASLFLASGWGSYRSIRQPAA